MMQYELSVISSREMDQMRTLDRLLKANKKMLLAAAMHVCRELSEGVFWKNTVRKETCKKNRRS